MMDGNSLITVIVTAYNIGKYLPQCLESVLSQTYKNIELIIVDDGSTDDTFKIVQQYQNLNPHIQYFYQQNLGVSVARNLGLSKARGSYVMFVDGDDYLDNNIITYLVNQIGDNTDIVCCSYKAFVDNGTSKTFRFYANDFTVHSLAGKEKMFLQLLNGRYGQTTKEYYTTIGVPWGKLYKKSFLDTYRLSFNPALRRMQDNMFNMYAFYYAQEIIYQNQPLYNYRLTHITDPNTKYGYEIWASLLSAREEFFGNHPEVLTDAIREARYYEVNIAFFCSASFISCTNKIPTSYYQLAALRKNPLFADIFCTYRKIPFKINLFRCLAKYKFYSIYMIALKIRHAYLLYHS